MKAEPEKRASESAEGGSAGPKAPARASGPITLSHLAAALFAAACLAGLIVVMQPEEAGLPGLTLLAGITVTGAALLVLLLTGQIAPGHVPASFFQLIAETDPKPVCLTAPDGSALFANRAWMRMFGQSPTGGIVLPVAGFSADQDSAQRLYRLVRASSLREAASEELRLRGSPNLHVRVTTAPAGRAGHSVWRVLEIPSRRTLAPVEGPKQNVVVQFRPLEPKARDAAPKADAAAPPAADAGNRFLSLFATAPVGIAIVDADGVVSEANAAFATFAVPHGEPVKGRALTDFLKDVSAAEVRQRLQALAQGQSHSAPADIRFKFSGKRTAHFYASALNPGGERSGAVVYLIETTDQTQLEAQFAQSQKMQAIGQLAGGVAHDFNNILTAINGNAEFLMQAHPPGDPSFQGIHQIRSNGLKAAGLVRQLLAFSRQQTMELETVSVTDIVSDWSAMLKRLIGERVQLRPEHGRDLWPVLADPNQLGNVLVNLAVNSRDAMPAGGTLTIRTSNASITDAPSPGSAIVPPGEYVLIEVADTGCGIAPENMSKIFEPFFTTKEKGQGTGLGLSSVYGIIQQSRGFIVPESETGKGTTFRIYLPRHVPGEKPDAPAVAPAAGEAAAPARDLTGHQTVLLVEDEEGVRDFAARALTMRGYKVLQASSGDEALELLRQHEGVLDLLVTDVLMPGMDGPTLAKTVRGLNPTLKVLFISGYPDDKLQNTGDRPEDFHFLAKPFSLKQLTSKVKDVLES